MMQLTISLIDRLKAILENTDMSLQDGLRKLGFATETEIALFLEKRDLIHCLYCFHWKQDSGVGHVCVDCGKDEKILEMIEYRRLRDTLDKPPVRLFQLASEGTNP